MKGPLSLLAVLATLGFIAATPAPVSAATFQAASCNATDVRTALTSATHDGDIVLVPAGNCTWTSEVDPPCSSWTLQGNGVGSTNITISNSGGDGIGINNCSGKSVRITGFTWTYLAAASTGIVTIWGGTGLSFRIDHNTFQGLTGWGRWFWDNVPCVSPGCVVDHNTIVNLGAIVAAQLSTDGGDDFAGKTQWSRAMSFDNGSGIYFEDNVFQFNNFFDNDMMDCMDGGRYTFRRNTVTGNLIFNHGYDSVSTSCLELTAYQNTIDGAFGGVKQAQAAILYRGGTGIVYSNILKNANQGNILVTNYRSNNSGANDIHTPFCGGGNSIDGNQSNGWPCYQQIGRGSSTSAPGLGNYPLYEWDNCRTSLGCTGTSDQNTITVYNNQGGSIDNTSQHIQRNRDFYDSVSGFTGASGVGIGSLSARPGSCTQGVGYWATDQQTLYQCSGNAWSVYYTPYTYPHPLIAGGSPPPVAPANLQIRLSP